MPIYEIRTERKGDVWEARAPSFPSLSCSRSDESAARRGLRAFLAEEVLLARAAGRDVPPDDETGDPIPEGRGMAASAIWRYERRRESVNGCCVEVFHFPDLGAWGAPFGGLSSSSGRKEASETLRRLLAARLSRGLPIPSPTPPGLGEDFVDLGVPWLAESAPSSDFAIDLILLGEVDRFGVAAWLAAVGDDIAVILMATDAAVRSGVLSAVSVRRGRILSELASLRESSISSAELVEAERAGLDVLVAMFKEGRLRRPELSAHGRLAVASAMADRLARAAALRRDPIRDGSFLFGWT